MADAVEPTRQGVEKKAADELVGVEGHDLLPSVTGLAVRRYSVHRGERTGWWNIRDDARIDRFNTWPDSQASACHTEPDADGKVTGGGADGAALEDALPRSLEEQLAKERRDVLALHIAHDPALALDLTIFRLARKFTGHAAYNDTGVMVTIGDLFDPAGVPAAHSTAAQDGLDAVRSGLPCDWAWFAAADVQIPPLEITADDTSSADASPRDRADKEESGDGEGEHRSELQKGNAS